jgi:hypothetical protein
MEKIQTPNAYQDGDEFQKWIDALLSAGLTGRARWKSRR